VTDGAVVEISAVVTRVVDDGADVVETEVSVIVEFADTFADELVDELVGGLVSEIVDELVNKLVDELESSS
jgi:CheY-specific phosphatase CheX